MTGLKKVLIVEDNYDILEMYRTELEGIVEIIEAQTISRARYHFGETPDLDAIVLDACVPTKPPNTPELAKFFRQTFKGPMIAASMEPEYRKMLLSAGCDYESPKPLLTKKLREILGV